MFQKLTSTISCLFGDQGSNLPHWQSPNTEFRKYDLGNTSLYEERFYVQTGLGNVVCYNVFLLTHNAP